MRIFPISDLHLERRSLDLVAAPPPDAFDVLACAGDVFEGRPERGLAALLRLAVGRPVVLVPGNHEHYAPPGDARTAPELLAALEAEAGRLGERIHLLQRGQAHVIDGVRFVGTTLWSDWTLAGRWLAADAPERPADPIAYAAARMTDPATGAREYLGAIRDADGRAWQPRDAMAAHAVERRGLIAALGERHDGPTVVVTHHPPSPHAAEAFRDAPGVPWWVPAFYASTVLDDLDDEQRPELWISGHFHAGHDLRVGRCRWVANPVDGASYRGDFVVEVPQ